jgi:hypothetical protein
VHDARGQFWIHVPEVFHRVLPSCRPLLPKLAAHCASGTGAICSMTERNPENLGKRRKRSNSSRWAIGGNLRRPGESFPDFLEKTFLKRSQAGVEPQAFGRIRR